MLPKHLGNNKTISVRFNFTPLFVVIIPNKCLGVISNLGYFCFISNVI